VSRLPDRLVGESNDSSLEIRMIEEKTGAVPLPADDDGLDTERVGERACIIGIREVIDGRGDECRGRVADPPRAPIALYLPANGFSGRYPVAT
jgi:hypothetical protein